MSRVFLSFIAAYTPVIWGIGYPFIYGQLLSRLFGLEKKIDHWILFFLHVSISILELILFFPLQIFFRFHFIGIYLLAVIFFAMFVLLEGLVWQLLLKDRKLNGFLISFICNVIFVLPYVIHLFLVFKNVI